MVCACVHTQVSLAWFLGLKTLLLKKENKNPCDVLKKSRMHVPCSFRYQLFCALSPNRSGQILRTAASRSVLLYGGVQTKRWKRVASLHMHVHPCTHRHRHTHISTHAHVFIGPLIFSMLHCFLKIAFQSPVRTRAFPRRKRKASLYKRELTQPQ